MSNNWKKTDNFNKAEVRANLLNIMSLKLNMSGSEFLCFHRLDRLD